MHYAQVPCGGHHRVGSKRSHQFIDSVLDGCWETNPCPTHVPCGTGRILWRFHVKPFVAAVRRAEYITGDGGERSFAFGDPSVLRRVGGDRARFDGNTIASKLPAVNGFGSFDSYRLSNGIYKGILVRKKCLSATSRP